MPKPTPVRIEARTYAAIAALAKLNRRSTTNMVEIALDEYITIRDAWPEEEETK